VKLTDLPIGDQAPELVHAVIEIPRTSKNKFEYRPEWEAFFLDRILAGPLRFPSAYGFIPQTAGMDGDAVDVLVIQEEPAITGCVVQARPVGMFRMGHANGEDVDEKVIAVSANDPMYRDCRSMDDLPEYLLQEIDYFFRTYKTLENDREYTTEWRSAEEAWNVIRTRHREYLDNSDGANDTGSASD
jgi:inorganic pyrophosphatase